MTQFQTRYKCPSCWRFFRIEDVLWIANSEELRGEDRLSEYDFKRFLPRHFTPNCRAIDEYGGECEKIACPHCYLEIPRAYLESKDFMVSIVGSRTSGKTYFVTSLVHWIKRSLFNFGFYYYEATFANKNRDLEINIEKLFPNVTVPNERVDLAGTVPQYGVTIKTPKPKTPDQFDEFTYPIPFMYSIKSKELPESPNYSVCIYDHSGEDFRAGEDHPKAPLTQHLGYSDALFFLFDPTQFPNFIKAYKRKQGKELIDNELVGAERNTLGTSEAYQDQPYIIFGEMTRRIQNNYKNKRGKMLGTIEKYDRPIIIVVSKCDTWMCLLDESVQEIIKKGYPIPEKDANGNDIVGARPISKKLIKIVSDEIHRLLLEYRPQFINVVDSFASDVTFIPVSATGCSPTHEGFVPGTLEPIWIGVPFLYALAKHDSNLVKLV
ncbi:MAG: hypothetical protein LBB88_10385 [Planctomycetaceae bacterium]|jgi:hypothetical protein|nr:hypothetical protein [Planctomycetaceae bacterium]